jgi:hypothetical protein
MPLNSAPAVTAMIMTVSAAATTARLAHRLIVGTGVGVNHAGRQNFRLQCLVLQGVEVAALRIAARRLPARNHDAGGASELAGRLDVEAEGSQPALQVAALPAVEAELIFGDLATSSSKIADRRLCPSSGCVSR